jgi:hypothetical protein
MRNSRNQRRATELLKDRRDYRARLIQQREDLETKIKRIEAEIRELQGVAGE